ncbi:RNA polymerase [Proteus phage Myduc]|uniref:Putative RNA polymerase n=1 Tax=Proteus phage Myduc TaxID=2650874 RepID=A0A5J6TAA1_9CAUD|nr:RNA polymerase [Proteus phage Myduc]QFG06624.1 putative RNA polymerase [Proteus phage Myduc]
MSTITTNTMKSVIPAITAQVFRAKEKQAYMKPQTCAIASLAIYNMMTSFTREDVVPAMSLVSLAEQAIEIANRYNNDIAEYHYTDAPIMLIGLAKHIGLIDMHEDKTFTQSMRWIELITTKEASVPLRSKPTNDTRRKPLIKGGKVKASKTMQEAVDFLESTEYHVESSMVAIVRQLLATQPMPEVIKQELHVWLNSEALADQDVLFSDYFGDNRGRLYHVACAGPNPQSSDFARSLYSLNVSAPVNKLNEDGSETESYKMFMLELQDVAGGKWCEPKALTRTAQNPVGALSYMLANENDAPKKPFTYIRLALDWFEFETKGVCDSRMGFGLDAKCSGTQYLAFIAGNMEMAKATGLVDTAEKSPDPYQLSLKQLMKRLTKVGLGISQAIMEEHLNPKTGRDFIKTPYMAVQYGGGEGALTGSSKFVKYAVENLQLKGEDVGTFAETCVDAVHEALGEKINLFISRTQEAVMRRLEETGKSYLTYRHTDGQLVLKPCFPSREVCESFSIRVDSATRVIFGQMKTKDHEAKPWTIREATPTKEEFVRTFVVNYIQGIDALVARTVAKYAKKAGLRGYTSIHDCFRTCLADAPKLMECIRKAYIEIFVHNNQFEKLSKQLGGIRMFHTNIVTEELLNSKHAYYFCQ